MKLKTYDTSVVFTTIFDSQQASNFQSAAVVSHMGQIEFKKVNKLSLKNIFLNDTYFDGNLSNIQIRNLVITADCMNLYHNTPILQKVAGSFLCFLEKQKNMSNCLQKFYQANKIYITDLKLPHLLLFLSMFKYSHCKYYIYHVVAQFCERQKILPYDIKQFVEEVNNDEQNSQQTDSQFQCMMKTIIYFCKAAVNDQLTEQQYCYITACQQVDCSEKTRQMIDYYRITEQKQNEFMINVCSYINLRKLFNSVTQQLNMDEQIKIMEKPKELCTYIYNQQPWIHHYFKIDAALDVQQFVGNIVKQQLFEPEALKQLLEYYQDTYKRENLIIKQLIKVGISALLFIEISKISVDDEIVEILAHQQNISTEAFVQQVKMLSIKDEWKIKILVNYGLQNTWQAVIGQLITQRTQIQFIFLFIDSMCKMQCEKNSCKSVQDFVFEAVMFLMNVNMETQLQAQYCALISDKYDILMRVAQDVKKKGKNWKGLFRYTEAASSILVNRIVDTFKTNCNAIDTVEYLQALQFPLGQILEQIIKTQVDDEFKFQIFSQYFQDIIIYNYITKLNYCLAQKFFERLSASRRYEFMLASQRNCYERLIQQVKDTTANINSQHNQTVKKLTFELKKWNRTEQ